MAKQMDTTAAGATSTTINSLNTQLEEALNRCRASMQSLAGNWTGKAADATISSFASKAAARFPGYVDRIQRQTAFLQNEVSTEYAATEEVNVSKADQI